MLNRRRFLGHVALAAAALPTRTGWAAALGPTPNPPFNDQVAQTLADARKANGRFPGMVAAIIRGDRLVGVAADGVRKVGSPVRVEVTDRFHLGSCTKAMAATVIASVVDSGSLSWESTLSAVFPDEAPRMHADYRGVTLDQLLRHRSGLPANVDWRAITGAASLTLQRRSLLASVLKEAPITAPGSTFAYSNLGYTLAALMAEEATATPWETLIRRAVFEPMGMTSAGFGPPGSDRIVDQPWGHRSFGPVFVPTRVDNPPVMGPAGNVHLSVGDWARFAAFHLGDGSFEGRKLLSKGSLEKLHTPAPGRDYAGGWIVSDHRAWADGPTWEHAGSNTVWFAYLMLAPRRHFGALVASNAAGRAEVACLKVADALLELEPKTRP